MDDIEVSCYSGHTYADEPRSFRWEGQEYKVEQVEKAWLEPGLRCFQVRAGENRRFKICYNEAQQRWSIAELRRGYEGDT
ncbi:MAG: hypothetical protein HYX91_03855 [Chloroflexi bacterium]|nr:hypothetical protein [Chloroflexota bacterium]